MASATGIPENVNTPQGTSEEEPLLGRQGDASQMEGQPLYWNLWLGTASIAQAGIWIVAGIVWGAILSHKLIFFSSHPLLNSAGLLLITQSTLILQPTHTASQKRAGTVAHFLINLLGITALLLGLVIIEINKFQNAPGHGHFVSPHALLGLIFYISILLQATVGFTQYYTPSLYGGVDNAKAVYKYHRASGYVIVTLGLAVVSASSWTDYNKNVLHFQHWAIIVASVLVLVGLVPRIRLQKFGIKKEWHGHERLGS